MLFGTSRTPFPTINKANSFKLKLNSWSILGGGTKMLAGANLKDYDKDIPMQSTN